MKSPNWVLWSTHQELEEFYSENRNQPKDLYPSERRFLPWLAKEVDSVLDTGCAAGGFFNIWRNYNQSIVYTGLDLSSSLIKAARNLVPGSTFLEGNVVDGVDLPDRSSMVVQALGWLHWEPKYSIAIHELWRLTEKFLFFDIRLVNNQTIVNGQQVLSFTKPWDGETTTPYIGVPWELLAKLIASLQPKTILGYGYWGQPANTVKNFPSPVCFSTFVLEKASSEHSSKLVPQVCLDLPLEWPANLKKNVEILPSTDLEVLVPRVED